MHANEVVCSSPLLTKRGPIRLISVIELCVTGRIRVGSFLEERKKKK